jgi:acyl carrier protein
MDVREVLNGIFQEVFDDRNIEITPKMTANDVEGWDSFAHVTLILAIETKFKIKFSMKEAVAFKNVGDLIRGVEQKVQTN